MTYYVFYVKSCSPMVMKFQTLTEAEMFVKTFIKWNKNTKDDNWIDFIVEGKVKPIDKHYKKMFRKLDKFDGNYDNIIIKEKP